MANDAQIMKAFGFTRMGPPHQFFAEVNSYSNAGPVAILVQAVKGRQEGMYAWEFAARGKLLGYSAYGAHSAVEACLFQILVANERWLLEHEPAKIGVHFE